MPYRWVEHTAEIELEIDAPTPEAVFTEALHALGELIGEGPCGASVHCELAVAGDELASLLVRWLDELVYRAEVEGLVPEDVERIAIDGHGIAATVRCHQGSPRHLVKAATYHRLAFERADGGYRAKVVLDV
jgi:protein archease